jgi:hypothetical protein
MELAVQLRESHFEEQARLIDDEGQCGTLGKGLGSICMT